VLLNSHGQIVKRLDAKLRSILCLHLWLGYSDWDQKTCTIAMLDLVADRHAAARAN
jgi:hypothetical protein